MTPIPARRTRRAPPASGIQVTVHHEAAATVVSVQGVAAVETPDVALGPALPRLDQAAGVVVVDLNGLTMVDRDVVRRLLDRLQTALASSGGRMMVVCRRSTARSLLRAWRLHDRMAIYPSIDAALR